MDSTHIFQAPDPIEDDAISNDGSADNVEESSVTESDEDFIIVETDDPFFEEPKNSGKQLSKKLSSEVSFEIFLLLSTAISSRSSVLHGLMTSQPSAKGSIRQASSFEAVPLRSMSRIRTTRMTRQAFTQRVRSSKLKVCLIITFQLPMLKFHKGPSAAAKVSADDMHFVQGASTVNGVPFVDHGGRMWPAYTNLVYSASGEVRILAQTDELKITVRKAISFMEEFIIFENAFPDLATRAAWARKALLKAANYLTQSKLTDYSHYIFLKRRLKEDPEYVKNLSSLVRKPHLSMSRSNIFVEA